MDGRPKKNHSVNKSAKTFSIYSDKDIVTVREYARVLAETIGFSTNQRTLIATAVSEICRNIIEYAQYGEVFIETVNKFNRIGITITIEDNGPGISDVNQAMTDGYSTGRGMGVGLPGTKRIMDEFVLQTQLGKGTKIVMSKWLE